ncbi:hypothetical protein JCM10213_005182 [Rhodosporidiobolus nylandii]
MAPDSPLTDLSPSPTSTLSPLTPSPPRTSPAPKRPRLSTTSPPPAALTLVSSPKQPPKAQQQDTFDDLLEGLDDDDFDVPPSSNPVAPREDDELRAGDGAEGAAVTQRGLEAVDGRAGARAAAQDAFFQNVAADDSGVGLLPEVEQGKPGHAEEQEPPDGPGAAVGAGEEEVEFEGDDMWLGFDDLDVGFDEPNAFPSSLLSAAGVSRLEKGKGVVRQAGVETDDWRDEPKEEPRLLDFGFSGLGGLGGAQTGGFVFATRKPFAVSEQAMQRARALLEAEDEPAAPASTSRASSGPPPSRSTTPLVRPAAGSRPHSRLANAVSRAASPALPPPAPAAAPSTLSTLGGFQTAAGSYVTLPSADAFARAQKTLQGSSSPLRPAEPASHTLPIPPPTARPPAFPGFQNAAGRALDMPSEEAMRKAREHLDARSSSPPPPLRPASRPSSRPPSRVPSRAQEGRDVFADSPAPLRTASRGSADTVAGAARFALAPPIARLVDESAGAVPPDSPTAARVRAGASDESGTGSSGRRTPLLPMDANFASAAALEAKDAEPEVGNEDSNASSTTLRSSPAPTSPKQHQACAAPAVPPAVAAPPPAPARLVAPIPVRPAAVASTEAFALASSSSSRVPSAQPGAFRSPLIRNTPARGPSASFTSLRPSSLAPSATLPPPGTPNPLLAGGQGRRLNLGMTPRSKPYHLANTRSGTPGASQPAQSAGAGPRTGVKAFKTPFKGGKPPEGLTPAGLKGKVEALAASAKKEKKLQTLGTASKVGKREVSRVDGQREKAKVFELNANGAQRFDLLNFGMRPQTHYYEELESHRLPLELIEMDSLSGSSYVFPCGRSSTTAFADLQGLVAERMSSEKDLVTLPWVQNHWQLVLWKIASYVRSRPDLLDEWWCYDRVIEQLRYRYEREINLAQRSCIKRVQEHDSPASLPAVLCVSQIRWDEAQDDSAITGDAPLVIIGLELTDGWYRIRASVDATLRSACERGKIVVGSKIAIMGAKLEASKNEGTDVLQGLSRSGLIISGNSTSLAPWHATLGFRPDPFVASLNKLTSAGGLVPLIDVVVERAFPCGYIDLRKGRGTETWGEEEERVRADEWKRGRKKIEARLADEAEKAGVEEDEIVELLQEAAEGIHPAPAHQRASTPSEEPDEILDRLESAQNKQAVLRKLSTQQIRACLALAQENAQASRYRAVEDLQKELSEKYPPRDVRGFRVVRVRDAREGTRPEKRTALLTIWDAQTFEEGFVKEGGRYLVSNTLPKGSWRRTDLEISLSTRRDTRWKKL